MKSNSIKKALAVILSTVMVFSLAACGSKTATSSTDTSKETINIKFLSNLPDRKAGQGKLEQLLIDKYMAENKNVKIEVEALQDEPYKQKFKAYASSNQLPDMYMVWGGSGFFGPIMDAGYAAELKMDDYKDYKFVKGSLDAFSSKGKLYGLPRNTDYMVLYYNKKLFSDNGIKVPTNYEEILSAAKAFRAKGISPIAMNGKDKWSIAIMIQDLAIKSGGDQKLIYDAVNGKIKFEGNEVLLKAAKDFKSLMDIKGFQDSFTSADYGAANNLFAQGKAAMYYMGSWEVGLDTNPNFSDEFKSNVDVINFPITNSGKGKTTDLCGWNGGGYAVSATSKNKAESIKLLNYMMKLENWSKNGWELGVVVPGQDYSAFLTGKETNLQKKLTDILKNSTSLSGITWQDALTPDYKTNIESLSQELASGIITPEEFLKKADEISAKARK